MTSAVTATLTSEHRGALTEAAAMLPNTRQPPTSQPATCGDPPLSNLPLIPPSPNTRFFTAESVFVSASSDVVLINIGSGAGGPTNCHVLIIYPRRGAAGEGRQEPRDEAAPSPAYLYKGGKEQQLAPGISSSVN